MSFDPTQAAPDVTAAVAELRGRGELADASGLTVRLARTFGFCQGVERAVARALEAARERARPRLILTGEIIHNPSIHGHLRQAGVETLPGNGDPARLAGITADDWVIVPAFGNTREEALALERIGCRIIDTTCGWVRRTWRTVERFAAEGLTVVIHGKVEHEETRATASRTPGPWVIVRNRAEAELLAAAIRRDPHPTSAAEWPDWFLQTFAGKHGPGFDPERDLVRLGLVNQTTMLAGETEIIARILGDALQVREPLRSADTFCPATQTRQDAMRELIAAGPLDAVLVVGGFRSSNTAHLAAIGAPHAPTYHVEDAEGLIDADRIRHLPAGEREPAVTAGWRPAAPCTIGVTAGASTPEGETDRVLGRLLQIYRGVAGPLAALALLLAGAPAQAHLEPPAQERPESVLGLPPSLKDDADRKAAAAARLGFTLADVPDEPDSSGYDALHVDLEVEPLFDIEGLRGSVEWRLRVTEPGLTTLDLDFTSSLTVRSARLEDTAATFTHADDRLRLHLPSPPTVGAEVRASIEYDGVPELGFLWGFDFREHDGVPVVFTQCEPSAARTWWPCKDRPDDKITADLVYIVPDTMIAASNGVLIERTAMPGGKARFHWREAYPISTYLVALTATNFVEFTDTYTALDGVTQMPLQHFAYPEHLTHAQERWAFTPQAIRAFADLFGEYPFLDEKYGMVEYPWGGAMEHQTLTSMGDYFQVAPYSSDWVVVHELAHQWWGDLVTCGTWRDIWLNEGFATYCEALWAEHVAGPDSLRALMVAKAGDWFPGSCYDPDFLFNSTVYRKGAWVMHMLRHVVGDELFFEALQRYAERFAYSTAVTEDLRAVFEEVSGRDLEWFFHQWVYGEGQPRYRVTWEPIAVTASGPTKVLVEIFQETTGPEHFKMPLDAVFTLSNGERFTTVLWDSLPQQQFVVTTPAPVDSLAIDPDRWVLGKVLFVSGWMEAPEAAPAATFSLGRPRPNPTRGETLIPALGPSATRVPLQIFDPNGRVVRRLEPQDAVYHWDTRDEQGQPVAAGVYHARVDGAPAENVRILVLR